MELLQWRRCHFSSISYTVYSYYIVIIHIIYVCLYIHTHFLEVTALMKQPGIFSIPPSQHQLQATQLIGGGRPRGTTEGKLLTAAWRCEGSYLKMHVLSEVFQETGWVLYVEKKHITSESSDHQLLHVSYNDVTHHMFVDLMAIDAGFHPVGNPPAGAGPEAGHDQAASNTEQWANRTSVVHLQNVVDAFPMHLVSILQNRSCGLGIWAWHKSAQT